MKKFIFLLAASVAFVGAQAQSDAHASMTTVQAKDYNISAVTIDFPISEKEMEDIFEDKLRNSGAGRKTSKWSVSRKYRYYPASTIGSVSTDKLDYYYLIDGNNDNSNVTVFMSRGYDNFINEKEDKEAFDNLMDFLESINTDVNMKNWEHRVEDQEENVKKYEKAVSESEKNLANQESSLAKLQQQIEETKAAIDNNKAELEKQKELLETIRSEKK